MPGNSCVYYRGIDKTSIIWVNHAERTDKLGTFYLYLTKDTTSILDLTVDDRPQCIAMWLSERKHKHPSFFIARAAFVFPDRYSNLISVSLDDSDILQAFSEKPLALSDVFLYVINQSFFKAETKRKCLCDAVYYRRAGPINDNTLWE